VIDVSVFQLLLLTITGWLDRREREALSYLIEENRVLRRQIGPRRLRLTDDDRRRLAVRAYRLGRAALRDVATLVTPDTLLRWHRQLVARKWTFPKQQARRRGVLAEIRQLVVRMAEENSTWGYMRLQGALKNLGHHVGRSMIARIRIDLASRRVRILGATPYPDEAFMRQIVRTLTMADAEECRVLICDRDAKWSAAVRDRWTKRGFESCRRHFMPRMRMHTRSGSCGRSRRSVSTG